MLTQEFWLVQLARTVIGLLTAWLAGALAFFAVFYVLLPGTPSLSVLTPSLVTFTAFGCGLGAAIAWFQPGKAGWTVGLIATTITAGLVGGWVAFLVGTPEAQSHLIDIQTGEAVVRGNRVTGLITRPGLQATLLGATLAANVAAAMWHLLRAMRERVVRRRHPPTAGRDAGAQAP